MRLFNRAPLGLAISVSLVAPSLTSAPESSQDHAWQIIKANLNEKEAEKRVIAVRVLGLLPGDPQAASLAEQTAGDEKPSVRAAAATAMGQLHAKSSVGRLHALLEDHEPSVALAAASALIAYKDDAAYDVYYEVLTGERKAHTSLTQQAKTDLRDPKKLATLGFEQGIGFVPFAGIGWTAFQVLRKDDVSPVRSAAARMLADDPDSDTGNALVKAASDNKSWLVRTAALEAIAKRGDAKLLDGVVPDLMDDNPSVRCTAAAAVIRLSTLAAKRPNTPNRDSRLNAIRLRDLEFVALLVAWAGNGCAAAIEQLGPKRYESRVFRLARNIIGNHEDTEEVVQNAFFEVFLRLAAFRGDSRFYTWFVRIALNEAAQQNRPGSSYGTRNWY